MSKNIKVTDEVYEQLYDLAEYNDLSLGKMITKLMSDTGICEPKLHTKIIEPKTMPLIDEFGIPIFEDTIPKRRLTDILSDIDAAKKTMDEEVNYCQDSDMKFEIKSRHMVGINKLWEEYNEAKK